MTQELHNNTWEEIFYKTFDFQNVYTERTPSALKIIDFIKTVEKEAYERGVKETTQELAVKVDKELRTILSKELPTMEGKIRADEREILKKKVEEKHGKQGTMSGTLGYQGVLAGIQAFKTEGDNIRDDLLSLLSEE